VKLVYRWVRRLKTGAKGFLLWARQEWLIVAAWVLFPVVAILRGCSWLHFWVLLILGTCLVISEMVNTAIEKLCDLVEPNYNEKVRAIKDICAGAAMAAGVALVVVGFWVIVIKGGQ